MSPSQPPPPPLPPHRANAQSNNVPTDTSPTATAAASSASDPSSSAGVIKKQHAVPSNNATTTSPSRPQPPPLPATASPSAPSTAVTAATTPSPTSAAAATTTSSSVTSPSREQSQQLKPRPLTVVTPSSPTASNGSLASNMIGGSLSSLASPLSTDPSDPSLKRAAGKAGRKRRPESVVASTHAPSVTDQAWASPAAVAAVSMSRIRGGSGLPDSGSDRESSTPLTRKPKHRGSYMGGSGDELDDVGYTDSDGGGSGGVATMRTERRATTTATSRKRISMVNEEGGGGGDPTMPPAPGAVGNLAGAPLGQRHHESMEHLAMQSSVTKNRSKFESSYSGSALALNAAAALGASPLTPKRGSEEDDPSNPSSPVARSTFSLSPSSNTPSGPSSNSSPTRIVPSASMSSVATPSRVGKSTAADLFGFGAASKRKPSTITASGDDPMSPQKFSIGGNGGGNTSAASSPAGGHVPEGGERAGTNGGLASAIGSGGSTATLSTHPALNISGGVGMRKGGRKASTMSLTSPSNDPDKSPRKGSKMKDSTMDFFRNEGLEEAVFPSSIDLGSLFGTKNNPQAAFDKMVQAARCYESVKPQWLKQQSSNSDHSPTHTNPGEEIKYRILENFRDGKLESLTYEKKNNATEFIASGPAEALIDALIFPLNQDNSYAEVFMSTYRFFIPALDVLTSLIEWYNVEVDEEATPQQEAYLKRNRKYFRARAIKSLLIWIKNHWHDFHCDQGLLGELMAFVAEVSEVSFGDSQKMTQAIREQRLSWYMTQYIPLFSAKRAAPTESCKPWGLLWEAEAFAEQLTLIDFDLFRQVRPDAYLHLMHLPVKRERGGENVALKVLLEYCSWFRLVSAYTATLVLREDSSKKKAKALKKFIKIARVCRDLNNFNTTFAIIYGLRRPAVMKQTSAWEQVPSKYLEILKDLEHTMDPADGYANFWMELKTTHPPAIPLFAAYIHDLLEIHHDIPIYLSTDSLSRPAHVEDDDTPTPTTTPMSNGVPIHFAKFYDLYAVVAELEVWRTASYSSVIQTPERETTAIVLNHLKDYPVMEERVLWEGAAAPGAGVGGAGSPGKGSPDRMGGLRRMGSFVAGEK